MKQQISGIYFWKTTRRRRQKVQCKKVFTNWSKLWYRNTRNISGKKQLEKRKKKSLLNGGARKEEYKAKKHKYYEHNKKETVQEIKFEGQTKWREIRNRNGMNTTGKELMEEERKGTRAKQHQPWPSRQL